MGKKMKEKDGLFGIIPNLIILLVELGILEPIICRHSERAKLVHIDPINGYFRLKKTNLVWMHVQDGYGVFINEYVKTRSGKLINLVEILSRHYWYIENRTGIIKCYELDSRALYRCIESIIIYGNINKKIPKWLEVHHKWWKWCNTQNAMAAVCYRRHQFFHNFVNSRKSHQKGIVISHAGEMLHWRNAILVEDAKLKNQPM